MYIDYETNSKVKLMGNQGWKKLSLLTGFWFKKIGERFNVQYIGLHSLCRFKRFAQEINYLKTYAYVPSKCKLIVVN